VSKDATSGYRFQSRIWDVDWHCVVGSSTHEGVNIAIQIDLGHHASRVAAWDVENGDVAWVIIEDVH